MSKNKAINRFVFSRILLIMICLALFMGAVQPMAIAVAEDIDLYYEYDSPIYADFDVFYSTSRSVTLPTSVPFRMLLPEEGGWGIVNSDTFYIVNNEAVAMYISINAAHITIDAAQHFYVSETNELPNWGNNINMTLIYNYGDYYGRYTLSKSPQYVHTFRLEGGESASFHFAGVLNELLSIRWADTNINVHLSFNWTSVYESEFHGSFIVNIEEGEEEEDDLDKEEECDEDKYDLDDSDISDDSGTDQATNGSDDLGLDNDESPSDKPSDAEYIDEEPPTEILNGDDSELPSDKPSDAEYINEEPSTESSNDYDLIDGGYQTDEPTDFDQMGNAEDYESVTDSPVEDDSLVSYE